MKFYVSSASDYMYEVPCEGAEIVGRDHYSHPIYGIEINTLEELVALSDKLDAPIIVGMGKPDKNSDPGYAKEGLLIYDGDIE